MTEPKLPKQVPQERLLDSIADGIFTVDLDFNITFFNRAASQITGVPVDEALGQKCWEVLHSSVCDGFCALKESIEHDHPIGNKSIFIVKPDGTKVPINISAAPLKDNNNELVGGVETFRDLTEIQLLRKKMEGLYTFEDIVGRSQAIVKIFQILPQIAKSEATVLILGESGTGKELFARAIHHLSNRKDGPMIAVNCGALPEQLLESELFGYKAGAFTDAKKDKPGRFELAQGGTIFLDEVGDLPAHLQVKLLRVLQEKTFEPLGSVKSVPADVRVIAATNQPLEARVAEGSFRQDLFYRLNVVQLVLPPLRERREDVPLLINHTIKRLNLLQGKDIQGVSEDVLAILMRHDLPGNVREMENILEYAFILCPGGFIQMEHLPESYQPSQQNTADDAKPMSLEEIKCLAVHRALERNKDKKMATCRELGISKDTLRRMIQRCQDMAKS